MKEWKSGRSIGTRYVAPPKIFDARDSASSSREVSRLVVTKGHSESILDGDGDARGGEQNMPGRR